MPRVNDEEKADITFRRSGHKKDSRAALEVFKEVGWMDRDNDRRTDAAMLSLTGALSVPDELIRSLDRVFQIPQPHADWDF
jgi:hypothetical protein